MGIEIEDADDAYFRCINKPKEDGQLDMDTPLDS